MLENKQKTPKIFVFPKDAHLLANNNPYKYIKTN